MTKCRWRVASDHISSNTNGGAADFAIVLLNTSSVDASDFLFNPSQADQTVFGSHAASDFFL